MDTYRRQLIAVLCGLFGLTASAATRYVDVNSANPTPPYTNWATAANVIQDAVDAAEADDEIVVTNGVYASGGRAVYATMTNRVAVVKPLTLRSVNGPEFTVIQGYQMPDTIMGAAAIRCVYLTSGAVLSGFTLTNGATHTSGDFFQQLTGGGVWCASASAVVTNCTLTGNRAFDGGGAYRGTLNNCALTGNSASWEGGGASRGALNNCRLRGNSAYNNGGGTYQGTLNQCELTGNSSYEGGGAHFGTLSQCVLTGNSASSAGGGAYSGTLNNSIIYYNTSPYGGDYCGGVLDYCCTTPLPAAGTGNITNAPLFVDTNGWSNLRLQSNSPCINAGFNPYAPGEMDLGGEPRVVGGTVDMGAYEFQSPASTLSYAWAQKYGLPTDGSADFSDTDLDGHNNWQECRADTSPTNALSRLALASPKNTPTGVTVTWQSAASRSYFVERGSDLTHVPVFQVLMTNVPGWEGITTITDTTATNGGPYFYRVGVQ